MNKGWIRQLTAEAEADRAAFEATYGTTMSCACVTGGEPCERCIHPGNPVNQEEDDECWEEVLDFTQPGRKAQRARIKRNIERTIRAFVGRRLNRELADLMACSGHFGTRHGWGRKGRKRAKMELRGTYQRRGQNIENYTVARQLRELLHVTATPMTEDAASHFKEAWQNSIRDVDITFGLDLRVRGVCHG